MLLIFASSLKGPFSVPMASALRRLQRHGGRRPAAAAGLPRPSGHCAATGLRVGHASHHAGLFQVPDRAVASSAAALDAVRIRGLEREVAVPLHPHLVPTRHGSLSEADLQHVRCVPVRL